MVNLTEFYIIYKKVKVRILRPDEAVWAYYFYAWEWTCKMRLLLTFTAADYIISLFVKEEIKS